MNTSENQAKAKIAYSIREAVEATNISRTKIYELINQGVLPSHKLGRRTLILRRDLDAFLAALPAWNGLER